MIVVLTIILGAAVLIAYSIIEKRIGQRACPACGYMVSVDAFDRTCPRCESLVKS